MRAGRGAPGAGPGSARNPRYTTAMWPSLTYRHHASIRAHHRNGLVVRKYAEFEVLAAAPYDDHPSGQLPVLRIHSACAIRWVGSDILFVSKQAFISLLAGLLRSRTLRLHSCSRVSDASACASLPPSIRSLPRAAPATLAPHRTALPTCPTLQSLPARPGSSPSFSRLSFPPSSFLSDPVRSGVEGSQPGNPARCARSGRRNENRAAAGNHVSGERPAAGGGAMKSKSQPRSDCVTVSRKSRR